MDRQAQSNRSAAQGRLIPEITQAFMSLKAAEEHVAAEESSVAQATEDVRIAETQYYAGVGLLLNVINAEYRLLMAHRNLTSARRMSQQAIAALLHAVWPLLAPHDGSREIAHLNQGGVQESSFHTTRKAPGDPRDTTDSGAIYRFVEQERNL